MGEVMRNYEKIDDCEFNDHLSKIGEKDKEQIINECIISLNKCDYDWKIRCIAWMSLIANSDGFMSPEEWKLIYHIYYTQLKLDLSDILEIQRQLPRSS